jgi:hypothetical protein
MGTGVVGVDGPAGATTTVTAELPDARLVPSSGW